MFIGRLAKDLCSKNKKAHYCVRSFLEHLQLAFTLCTAVLLEKMPLQNKILKSSAFLDPRTAMTSQSLKYLGRLPDLVKNVIRDNTTADQYDLELRKFQDDDLPAFEDGDRIDKWWSEIQRCGRYPQLSRMALALLTCFHGPQVENSFSAMNNIINEKTPSLDLSTYSALQSVRYNLKAANKSAIQFFRKEDPIHDRVDPALVKNMASSRAQYTEKLANCVQKKRGGKATSGSGQTASTRKQEGCCGCLVLPGQESKYINYDKYTFCIFFV